MSSVNVVAISLPRSLKRFVQTWFSIYENDPHWVPPLFAERKRFFDPAKNPYFKHARVAYFIATRDGCDVGTIAATIDMAYQRVEPGTAFFGFFEFVNDVEVAGALLGAARRWLGEQGMDRLLGPFNFNTNHEFGLLVDGFDSDQLICSHSRTVTDQGVFVCPILLEEPSARCHEQSHEKMCSTVCSDVPTPP